MRVPFLGQKFAIPAIISTAALSAGCLVINAWNLPGWSYAGTVEILVLAATGALFGANWSPITVRYGILVYTVITGLLAVAKNHPAIFGDFSFGNALGPFANNVGLLMAFPWFLAIIFSYPLAAQLSNNIYLRSLLGAAIAMVPSIFLLYNSSSLDFYYWTDIIPPLRVYVVFFIAFFILHFAGAQMQIRLSNPLLKPFYVMWFGFNFLLFLVRFMR